MRAMVNQAEGNTLRYILLIIFRVITWLSYGLLFLGVLVTLVVSLFLPYQSDINWMQVRDGFMLLAVAMILPAFFGGMITGFIAVKKQERFIYWLMCGLIFGALFAHWLYWAVR